MSLLRRLVPGLLRRYVSGLRFPLLFVVTVIAFGVNVAVPDALPFADEILLALAGLVLGRLREKAEDRRRVSGDDEVSGRPDDASDSSAGGVGIAVGLLVGSLLLPTGVSAQSLGDVMRAVGSGGRWVSIPIREGRGSLRTRSVPTYGLPVRGCVQVWEGHSGVWELDARDLMGSGSLEVTLEPGERSPFRYRLGREAQLDLEVEWSEPRDTTLMVWVGVDLGGAGGGECAPARGPDGSSGRGGPGGRAWRERG